MAVRETYIGSPKPYGRTRPGLLALSAELPGDVDRPDVGRHPGKSAGVHHGSGAWPGGNLEAAVDEFERLGDVLRVVAAGRRDVSGQGEIGQRPERQVGCPADARLEDTATEHRDPL